MPTNDMKQKFNRRKVESIFGVQQLTFSSIGSQVWTCAVPAFLKFEYRVRLFAMLVLPMV